METARISMPSPIDSLDVTVREHPFQTLILFVCPGNPVYNGVLSLPVNELTKGLIHMLIQSDLELGALSDIGPMSPEDFRMHLINTARVFSLSEGADAADEMLKTI